LVSSGQPEGRTLIADVRRREIAEIVRTQGSVSVAEVEDRFGVSSMTARRDLAELERLGVARRTHGGAVAPELTSHEDSFVSRLERRSDAKVALADAAAAMVVAGESVFLDSSSTAYHVARALVDRAEPVTVITNSEPIMDLVASQASGEVHLIGIGGSLRRLTRSFVGPVATGAVRAHFPDHLFFSVKGLTRDGTLTDADPLEAEVKRSMIEHADAAVLLIDGSKLEARGLSVIGRIGAVSTVLAAEIPAAELASLAGHGVDVRQVPATEGEA
jgi:DeoR/GlpR family transcriptional regulator of sugar metabolism